MQSIEIQCEEMRETVRGNTWDYLTDVCICGYMFIHLEKLVHVQTDVWFKCTF